MKIFNTIIEKCKFILGDLIRCCSIAQNAYKKSLAEKSTKISQPISVSMCISNTDWKETKKQKTQMLKGSFVPAQSIEEVIQKAQKATNE